MLALQFSDDAEADLLAIADAESDISAERANSVLDALEDGIELLRQFPGVGHPHAALTRWPEVSVWNVDKYVILFLERDGALNVVRIVPGSSDLRSLQLRRQP